MSPSEKLKTTLAESKKCRQRRPWPSAGQLDQWVSCSEFLYLIKGVPLTRAAARRRSETAPVYRPAGDGRRPLGALSPGA